MSVFIKIKKIIINIIVMITSTLKKNIFQLINYKVKIFINKNYFI